MERRVSLAGAPVKMQSRRQVNTLGLVSAAAVAMLVGQQSLRAATVYFVGENSAGAADDNFDDAAADTNFNTTDTQPGTTNYVDGDAVIFSDLYGASSTAPLTITVNAAASGSGNGPAPASITFEADGGSAATAAYQFTDGTAAGGISGSGGVTLASNFEGFVQFNSANSYTGTTTIDGGTLHTNGTDLSTNAAIVLGGTGTLQTASNATFAATQSISVTAGSNVTINDGAANPAISAPISSTGGTNTVLNFTEATSGSTISMGPLSGFSGTIELGNFSGGNMRLNYTNTGANTGSANAIFDFGAGTASLFTYDGGGSGSGAFTGAIPLGALEGTATTASLGGAHHSGTTYYSIGALGLNTTFAGEINEAQAEPFAGIYNVGGSLTLTGNYNTFGASGGNVNIVAGAIYANNTSSTSSATGTDPVQVVNYIPTGAVGRLGGTGFVTGLVTVNLTSATAPTSSVNSTLYNNSTSTAISSVPTSFATGGHISPGVPSQFNTTSNSTTAQQIGTLTLNGGLTLNDYSNLDFALGSSPTTGDDMISMGSAGVLTLPSDDTSGQDVMVNFSFTGAPTLGTPYTLISYSTPDVNGSDVADWNASVPNGDSVTFADTGSAITATFGAPVPEPTSLGLLAVGAGSLLVRRRRGPVTRLV